MVQQMNDPGKSEALDGIASYFDEHGDMWKTPYEAAERRWWQYDWIGRREKCALEMIRDEPKGAAVDLGCGIGHALVQMKRMGFERVVGVDISEQMLADGRKLLARHNLTESIQLHRGDVQNLDMIESGSIDACTALGVIEYLDEDGPMLREIHRILRPGGAAVIQVRNNSCIQVRTLELIRSTTPSLREKIVYRLHCPKEICASLTANGLSVEQERYVHFYALFPLNLIPLVRRIARPIDYWLSRKCEALGGRRFSRFLASMHIVKVRKPPPNGAGRRG